MNLKRVLVVLFLFCSLLQTRFTQAQNVILYSHYYFNPSLYNPAYTGASGYNEVFMNFRKQWTGFEGAPTTATLNLHLPMNYKTSLGVSAFQDQLGIIRTTTAMGTFAHQVYFGQRVEDVHKLAFGISAGITNSFLKDPDNPDDPAIPNNTTYFVNGQFGMYYQLKNFNVSVAIPTLLKTYVVSDVGFNKPGFDAINNTVSSISYRFTFNNVSFEPFLIYRTSDITKQFEAMGIVRLKNIVWFGGSVRQDFGYAALAGFQMAEQFKIGYAYELYASGVAGFNNGTHEIQIALRFGKKMIKRPSTREPIQPVPVVTEEKAEELREEQAEEPIEESKTEQPVTPVVTPVKPVAEPVVTPIEPVIDPAADPVVKPVDPIVKPVEPVAKPIEPIVEIKPEPEAKPEPEQPRDLDGEQLAPGHYVVVGVFKFITNAQAYKDQLGRATYPAQMAFVPAKNYYIVHLGMDTDIKKAILLRDKYRQQSRYSLRDTWILTVD